MHISGIWPAPFFPISSLNPGENYFGTNYYDANLVSWSQVEGNTVKFRILFCGDPFAVWNFTETLKLAPLDGAEIIIEAAHITSCVIYRRLMLVLV